eukprot:COSAG01_NODE_11141_length_1998_cov_1.044234_1_plen_129_part_10
MCLQALDDLRAEKELMEKTINSLEAEKARLATDVKQLTDAEKSSRDEATNMNKLHDDYVTTMTKDKGMLDAEIADKAATIDALEHEISDLKDMMEKNSDDYIANITDARNALSEQLSREKARAAAAEAE